jgi:hypothetical protein
LDKDDNKVLGATSAEGMPLTRDDASAEGMPLTSDDALIQRKNIDADTPVEDDNDVEVNDVEVDVEKRDAFGNVIAPEGYVYTGKLVFICFGPTSKYFAGTLAMGGQSDRTVEEKKEGSRKVQCKVTTDRNNVDREVGFDRGLTMQWKMQCAMMAQNEDDIEQRHHDIRMMMITKQIESTERLVELKLKTSERMSSGGSEAQVFLLINLLMEKLERLNGDLETMMNKKRMTNPIIGYVLVTAAKTMGLAKGDEDIDVNTDFVSDILNEL